MRILIADDQHLIRDLLRMLLQRLGATEILTVSDGRQALDAIAGFRPDCMILDISMPGMNGLEVLRDVRAGRTEAARDTTIMLLSADTRTLAGTNALVLDAHGFLAKPFTALSVRAQVLRATKRDIQLKSPDYYKSASTEIVPEGEPERRYACTCFELVPIGTAMPNTVLAAPIRARDGREVIAAGTELSPWLLIQLRDLARAKAIAPDIAVRAS